MQTQATHTLEIELALTGTFQPGCPAWGGSRFERPTNPPEDDSVEDVAIEGLSALRHVFAGGKSTWVSRDLLTGVNVKSPDIQKLFENLLAFVGEDAEAALIAEAA